MAVILHNFERCTYQTYQTSHDGEWFHGIAKVSSLGMHSVAFIIDINGDKVNGVYDYRLSGPSYHESTAIVLREEVKDDTVVRLPSPLENKYIMTKQYAALMNTYNNLGRVPAVRELRFMTQTSLREATNVIDTWFKD